MIDAATSVLLSPPRRPPAPAPRGAADDFRRTLDTVADKPAAKADAARPLTGRRKKDDVPVSAQDADAADVADARTCGTSRPGKGQGLAGGGKTLPDKFQDDDETRDPIWMPVSVIAQLPNPATCPLVLPKFGGVIAPAAGDPALATSAPSPAEPGAQLGEAIEGAATSPDWAPASAGEREGEAGPIISKDGLVLPASLVAAEAGATVRIDAPPPAMPQAMPQPATQPAGQAFAAAIAAALQAQPKRDEREPTDMRGPLAVAGATMAAPNMPAIAATADAKQSALDLRQDSGLQGMINHIEVLRDNADAGDTRIRLVPDALGAVDVSVRKDGDRVHVHFNAENAASARLLSEAQPRLADLADARGVKLGQTSVDSGAGNARQQPAATIAAAAPEPAARAESTDTIIDTRIA